MTEKNRFKTFSITLITVWLVIFVLLPTLMGFAVSLMTSNTPGEISPVFTLNNYKALKDPVFIQVMADSFEMAFITTILCLLVGYPFAYNLSKYKGKFKTLLLVFIIIPFWTSSLIRTYAIIVIIKTNGVLNNILMFLGIIDEPLRLMYTESAVLVGMVYSLLPFMILPLYAVLEKLDYKLIEAAKDLGAGRMRTFFHVVLPLSMPGVIAGSMLVFLPTLCLFYISDVLGGAKSLLIGNFIRNQFLLTRNWPLGAAASMILTVIMFVIIYVYYRSTKQTGRDAI
ncbi:spermidine/putrescine ABC transporter permease PotB [Seleniivibrio woodruffii]|uniref:ABC-type spermidine/putrescine transport system permease subunit I n=1 Tax=Seleniivibrio woodruffii TaxID=1078050 RepID=A0A4R1K7Y2_9BACT|nr:spermidine/putrescine ABC transporter permease PotB [Seleniivibrio woodruffii]TCK60392.1 ABC-type spermidine/putrescine transport system permease subunit I [Seleniivibrio woodruffii]TVZ36019.1 spermidine/putrescine transport system permease protein [Seleniivibrio woodruffii]